MESLTYFKNIKISPKKMRFMAPVVKKMKPAEALEYLYYSPEKSGKIFYKIIHSAVANAKNTLKVNDDMLQFKLLTVEQGQKLKRYRAGARGSARPIMKRFSHVKIIIEELSAPLEGKDVETVAESKKINKPAKVRDSKVVKEKKTIQPVEKKVKSKTETK